MLNKAVKWVNDKLFANSLAKKYPLLPWLFINAVPALIAFQLNSIMLGYLATNFAFRASYLQSMRFVLNFAIAGFYVGIAFIGARDLNNKHVKADAETAREETIAALEKAARVEHTTWKQRVQTVNSVLAAMRQGIFTYPRAKSYYDEIEDEYEIADQHGIPKQVIDDYKRQNPQYCCAFSGKLALNPMHLYKINTKTGERKLIVVESDVFYAYTNFTSTSIKDLSTTDFAIDYEVRTMLQSQTAMIRITEFFQEQAKIYKPVLAMRAEAERTKHTEMTTLYSMAIAAYTKVFGTQAESPTSHARPSLVR